jgi:hypothetical protein
MVGGLKRADGTGAVLEFALVNPGQSRAMAEEEGVRDGRSIRGDGPDDGKVVVD